MRVTRFDHSNLHGPNIDRVVEFFTELLDFSLTEAAETPDRRAAAFLSCSNKAHDIAFIRRDEPGKFHHVAFSLDFWHEVGQAADIIARYDIPLDIGPTRHGITRGQTIYFFDPSGQPQRGVRGRLHLLSGQPEARLVDRQDRQGDLLLSAGVERALYERRYVTRYRGLAHGPGPLCCQTAGVFWEREWWPGELDDSAAISAANVLSD